MKTGAEAKPEFLREQGPRLLLFGGKGGVGKTTLACASALCLAEKWSGKEILLFSIDPAHSLAACLGREIGPREVRVAPGLTAFDREVMERFLDLAPPGLDEMMVELSKRVKAFRRVLIDSEQAALAAVTIPTEMAYVETSDLVAACERLGVEVPILFVNRVTPPSSCPTCSVLRRAEEPLLGRYDAVYAGRHVVLVFRQEEPRGLERLRALGRALYVASGLPDVSQTKRSMQWNLTGILA